MNFLEITLKRLVTDTPIYFKKIRQACLWFLGVATAFIGFIHIVPSVHIPDGVMNWIYILMAIATGLTGTASVTTTDKQLADQVPVKNTDQAETK